jgi:outer membrane lipase/esterase
VRIHGNIAAILSNKKQLGGWAMKSTKIKGLLGVSVVAACATGLPIADQAKAQTVFTTIQAFGDSYADTGNLFKIIGPSPIYPTGRFSGGTNFVDTTSMLLGIPQVNFAVGGAKVATGPTGFTQITAAFLASGKTIAPSDLVEISIGGNDARGYYQAGGSLAGVNASATAAATAATTGLNSLVTAGARTIVWTAGDVSALPESAGFSASAVAVGSAYSQNYNAQMEAALANIARSGVRVEYIDNGLLGQEIVANPARYGFTSVGICPAATCIGTTPAAIAVQNQYLFYVDGIHLTSHGFAILGEYIVNRLDAPLTFSPQADLGVNSALGFASTLFGRLDTFQQTYGLGPSAMNAYNAYAEVTKAPPYLKAPPIAFSPWSFYMQATGGISNREATVASNGFNLESVGGTIGSEYRINNNAFVGGAFDYANPRANQFNNAGTTDVNSYQLGIYSAWADAHFFAQGLATIGRQDYRNTRPGVVDTITSNPEGTSFVVAGKLGYLFDAGESQIGPIGGLTYAHVRVDGYTESGDPVLTLNVGQQTAETLIGSVGAQFRTPFTVNGRIILPYLNLTLDDNLIGNGRIIQFGATSAPLIVNNWAIPNSMSDRVYGRVAGGVVAPVSNNVALTLNLARTLGQQGGDDFYGTGGLRVSF